MQAVYRGKSPASCPSKDSFRLEEAKVTGCKFTYSGKDNHWSTHKTMQELVNEIIAPYFEMKKKDLGKPVQQKPIWLIDCWTVHCSWEFLGWMKEHHPNIIVLFVPANCTGVFQPCDVGIQRALKLSIKRSSHEDVVREIAEGFTDEGILPHEVRITKSLPI
ncbi:MAG TPA: hypothetical protein VGO47_12700, partial [Chlamydiales bacterium]|nr:hypothetical protein [Chlamydiales bacterium]